MKNKKLYYMAALGLGLSLLLSACGSGAKSMRLRKTEGTVQINNAKDKELKTKENLKLYSGYSVRTKSESYAWVDLDKVKLTKLDQDSRAEIIKDGKDLTIDLISGSIFFNVTEPLADNESMDIRTSTLAIGIRGTCGWVETSQDDDTAWVYLLEGKVECTMGDESVRVRAGEMATITEDGELVVEEFDASAIPSFVQDEADANEDVDKMIQKVSNSGASSAPQGSGSASGQGGADTDADGQGGMDAIFGQGDDGTWARFSPGEEDVPATPAQASNPGFIPWSEAGLADREVDWPWTDGRMIACSSNGTAKELTPPVRLSDIWEITDLHLSALHVGRGSRIPIADISVLGEMKNLTYLYLDESLYTTRGVIEDISALSGLTNLTDLTIVGNQISDISALSGLTNLTKLTISGNKISDVSALSGLTNLQTLNLSGCPVTDYSPVAFVPNLTK